MYMYRCNYKDEITKHEVTRETPKQVFFINRNGVEDREFKETQWQTWHYTFEDARKHLIAKAERDIRNLEHRINMQTKIIYKLEHMGEP